MNDSNLFVSYKDDSGFYYVCASTEMKRPVECRHPCVILIADAWSDDGEIAAQLIAKTLSIM